MSKQFKTAAVLCAAVLLLGADANLVGAQSSGGGRGGAYRGSGYSSGGYGYGPSAGGYGYSGYGRGLGTGGFYGGGLFYGDYITGGGYPGYFAPYAYPARPFFYATPAVPYSARSITYYPATATSVSHYFAPSEATYAGAAPLDENRAAVHLVVPDPKATVLFDGNPTTTTGSERVYQTPELSPGGTYYFQLQVTWIQKGQPVTQEQTIAVIPGRTTEVVFAPKASEAVPTVSVVK